MADEIVYKKMTRKADRGLEGKVVAKHGKQTTSSISTKLQGRTHERLAFL